MCSTNILPDLLPGAGYKIILTNIVNYTDIYATSEEFEVHPKGSKCSPLWYNSVF